MEALAAIGKLRSKPAEARLLVRVCCAIGASDGNFDETEKQAVKKICKELGLDPAEFDL
jgi:tellurite resistance protein TerB